MQLHLRMEIILTFLHFCKRVENPTKRHNERCLLYICELR